MTSTPDNEPEWAKEESLPPPAEEPPPRRLWLRRPVGMVQGLIGFAAFLILVVLVTQIVRSCEDRETILKRDAYTWSQLYVKNQLLDPEKTMFPTYPDDAVDISMDEKEERFIVRARIEIESPTGVRVYHTYTAELLRHRTGLQWDLVDLVIR